MSAKLIILIFLGVVAYLNIGYAIGKLSSRVYYDPKSPEWLKFILFPCSTSQGEGEDKAFAYHCSAPFENEESQGKVMAVCWLGKMLGNLLVISVTGIVFTLVKIVMFFLNLLLFTWLQEENSKKT